MTIPDRLDIYEEAKSLRVLAYFAVRQDRLLRMTKARNQSRRAYEAELRKIDPKWGMEYSHLDVGGVWVHRNERDERYARLLFPEIYPWVTLMYIYPGEWGDPFLDDEAP